MLVSDMLGGDCGDHGGFAAIERKCDVVPVSRAARQSERWRSSVQDAISARIHALGIAVPSET